MDAVVVVTDSQILRPSSEVRPVKFQLTLFEGIMRYALYQKRILFFKAGHGKLEEAVEVLKASLRDALVPFFPFAGRIEAVSTNASGLELDCSTELSVQFREAKTEALLEELGNFEPSEFCDSLCDIGGEPKYPWSPQTPLLVVQVTRFACGGMSLGVAFSHQVCDGVSFWHFMNSWAEIARTGKFTTPPDVTYGYKCQELSRKELIENAKACGFKFKDNDTTSSSSSVGILRPKPDKLCVKLYKLDRAAIVRLKSQAVSECSKTFSTFELVCAHFWRKMAVARDPKGRYDFLVLSNTRGKLVTKAYFGNAIASVMASSTVDELSSQGVSYAAAQLHEAITKPDLKQLEGFLAFMSSALTNPELSKSLDFLAGGAFSMVVSSPRHPVYECDFGFGKPVGVTFGTNDLDDGKLYLFPSAAGDGGIDVLLVLQPQAMEKLQQDAHILP